MVGQHEGLLNFSRVLQAVVLALSDVPNKVGSVAVPLDYAQDAFIVRTYMTMFLERFIAKSVKQ